MNVGRRAKAASPPKPERGSAIATPSMRWTRHGPNACESLSRRSGWLALLATCAFRRQGGPPHVFLSGDFQVRTRKLGFDNLTPIRWQKVANINMECSRSSRFLGKPNLPNGVVKTTSRASSFLQIRGLQEAHRANGAPFQDRDKRLHEWFSPVWTDVKGQHRRDHPAPFPLDVPRRLIRMFSFAGDTVVDPFGGTGTTALAALETGRNSISVEIEPSYVDLIEERLNALGSVTANVEVLRDAPPAPVNASAAARA